MAGQIIPRGERTWLVRVFTGRDAHGKRSYHNETVHGTKKDAQAMLNDLLTKKDRNALVAPSTLTCGDYLDRWLQDAARVKVRERTLPDYKQKIDAYIRPVLGDKRLSKITALDVQALYSDMLDRGLSPRTVRYVHAVLSSALKQAVRWRILSANPADNVTLPRQKREEMHALTKEEAGRFLAAAKKDAFGTVFAFAVATGMRPSEYLALTWGATDLKAGTARVERTIAHKKGGGWIFDEPKTAKGRRTIPLPASMVRELEAHRRSQIEKYDLARVGASALLFSNDRGEPVDEHNLIQRHFKPTLVRAGLGERAEDGSCHSVFRLYDLRHTCATLLLLAGENPKIVSERLGHASVTLTLDTYSHVLPTMQAKAAERLEEALWGTSNEEGEKPQATVAVAAPRRRRATR